MINLINKELFTESMRNTYLDAFQKDRKKFLTNRILLAILVAVVSYFVAFSFGLSLAISISSAVGGLLVGYKIPYMQILVQKSNEDVVKSFMFPQFLRFFIGLFTTKVNVYQTLIETSKYVDEPLYTALMDFIDDIGEENDYARYVEFANFIGTTDAQLVMSMIYNFSEKGAVPEELLELERTSKKILDNKFEEAVMYKAGKQEVYMNYIIFLSVGYLMTFVFGVMAGMLSTLMQF